MLRAFAGPPVDYRLCDQTVTVYHLLGTGSAFACTRTVFRGAFLDWKKVQAVNKTGSRDTHEVLLVLPSGWDGRPVWADPDEYAALSAQMRTGRFTLAPQDKVLWGEGPEISTREQWSALVPGRRSGLVVLQQVDPKLWRGTVTHVEGGG